MAIKQTDKEKIKELTGYELDQIALFTEGQFIVRIYRLYFAQRISDTFYYWLKGYWELSRKGKIKPNQELDEKTQEILGVLGGSVLAP